MLKNISKKRKKKKGFTLIELIVVLAVLAIIALIAIPNFTKVRESSKIKSDERSADMIDKMVTTLVLDGSIEPKGNFTVYFNGKEAGSPYIGDTSNEDAKKIAAAIEKTKVQQSKSTDHDGLFAINLRDLDKEKPIVEVVVGNYNSDSGEVEKPETPEK